MTSFGLGKLRRFLAKDRRDRALAVKATLREFRTRIERRPLRRLLSGGLAAPQVLASRSPVYVAYRPDWDVDFCALPELQKLSGNWVSNNVDNNSGDLPRLYALVLNIRQVMEDGVSGDFAEIGVYRGNSAAVLAHYGRRYGRTTFLFDTFEGFEVRDLKGIDKEKPHAFTDTSISLVRQNVGDEAVVYVQGYFPESVTEDMMRRKYSVVHLDCDLYAPIKAGLEFFYDRLSPGGVLIVHDYSNPGWDGAKRAVDEFMLGISEGLVLMPDKSGTAMIRKGR